MLAHRGDIGSSGEPEAIFLRCVSSGQFSGNGPRKKEKIRVKNQTPTRMSPGRRCICAPRPGMSHDMGPGISFLINRSCQLGRCGLRQTSPGHSLVNQTSARLFARAAASAPSPSETASPAAALPSAHWKSRTARRRGWRHRRRGHEARPRPGPHHDHAGTPCSRDRGQ